MDEQKYVIVKDKCVLSSTQWVGVTNLFEGEEKVCVFDTSQKAQSVQSVLPKKVRSSTTVRSIEYLKGLESQAIQRKKFPLEVTMNESVLKPHMALLGLHSPSVSVPPTLEENALNEDGAASDVEDNAAGTELDTTLEPMPDTTADAPYHSPLTQNNRDYDVLRDNELAAKAVKLCEVLMDVKEYIEEANKVRGSRQSKIELQIQDELHYIEFTRLGTVDGYRCYQRLRQLRLERRKIKDTYEIIDRINLLLGHIAKGDVASMTAFINGMSTRGYRLRMPNEFEH